MQDIGNHKKLILDSNLRAYFFNGLVELNKKSLCPIPESILFYSSDVLDKFSLSNNYFDFKDGKAKEKVLGMKLLEASQLNREEQKKIYLEVGETSLVLCGYFSQSINKKIIDIQYYTQLGKMAYGHLNHLIPKFLDIPSFYGMVSTSFDSTITLISLLAIKNNSPSTSIYDRVLKGESLTETELLISGVLPNKTNKAS
jgi:hypothetical protein